MASSIITLLKYKMAFLLSITSFLCSVFASSFAFNSASVVERLSAVMSKSATVETRFQVPVGYHRVAVESHSFAFYLRNFNLKKEGENVYLFNGQLKNNQSKPAAVLNIDCGKQDLQQCADAVMRLRAEYLFSQKRYDEIGFEFLSDKKIHTLKGFTSQYNEYTIFCTYMNHVFNHANTRSLHHQLKSKNIAKIAVGDVFIQTGNPYGHAVIVMDVAINNSKEPVFLLAQSYMPAQDIHILKNTTIPSLGAWFTLPQSEIISTPDWNFTINDLKAW